MLLEQLLPYYFLFMILPISLGYKPTSLELSVMYGFAFFTLMFNEKLYRENLEMRNWGDRMLRLVDEIQRKNRFLIKKLISKSHKGDE